MNVYRYVGNGVISWIDSDGLFILPADPTGLGDEWTPDPNHLNPNGERFTNPNGDTLDFHKGCPGKPGWRGKDHWHYNNGKKHLKPGDNTDDSDGDDDPPPPAAVPKPLPAPSPNPIPSSTPDNSSSNWHMPHIPTPTPTQTGMMGITGGVIIIIILSPVGA